MPKSNEAEDLLQSIGQQARYMAEQKAKLDECKLAAKEQREEYEQAAYELQKLCLQRDEVNPLLDAAEE